MSYISIPLKVHRHGNNETGVGRLLRDDKENKSIDEAISLLLSTHQFSTPADPEYGFVFINLRFEIFNENEGVVFNSGDDTDIHGLSGLYDKKISGSSKNMNTFAAELKNTLSVYEKRLENISVAMTYIREKRMIYITVKATISSTQEPYIFTTTINVWK